MSDDRIEYMTETITNDYAYCGEVILVREEAEKQRLLELSPARALAQAAGLEPAGYRYYVHLRDEGDQDEDAEHLVIRVARDDLLALRDLLNAEFPPDA